ncbi:hypothetical protein CC2G_014688 [Coprinopsis cinerea AmutBmut pab1-1]|nr:hypothetical protein CC2G_014688 [Coprinopsis cinerea AmutBmut pab1-1]
MLCFCSTQRRTFNCKPCFRVCRDITKSMPCSTTLSTITEATRCQWEDPRRTNLALLQLGALLYNYTFLKLSQEHRTNTQDHLH